MKKSKVEKLELTSPRVKSAFGASFGIFGQIMTLGVANYVTNLAAFTLKNAIWVLAWATQMMTDLAAANLMPDKSSRAGAIAVIKTTLRTNTKACIVGANDLYSLIEQSFPKNLWAAQKEAAGSAHYGKATKKTSECSTMMSMGVTYITNNHAALMTGGMLAGFQLSFTGLGTAFDNSNTAYQNAIEAAALLTDAKVAAYNSIYARYQVMAKVGKNIFGNSKAVIEGIVYAQIKKKLNPPHQVVQPVNIPINGSKTIHNAVPLSTITVTGLYAVLICSGANACTIDTATVVNPGNSIPNTFGTEVTFTNVDLLHPTKVTITRLVNKNK